MWQTECFSLLGAAVSMSEELINRDDSIKQSRQQLCCLHTMSHKHWLTHNNINWQKRNLHLNTHVGSF